MGSTPKTAERNVIINLTEILKKNSDQLLSGETNLCLTTSSLSVLAVNFRRFSENAGHTIEAESSSGCIDWRSKKKDEINFKTWQDNIRTLIDFVWKVKALKIIHGSYTMKAPIQIHRFRSLQMLEIKRVPIHMVEGLSKLRGQLKEITVSKSLQTLKDLLEICGGDRTPGLVWPYLKTAYLSFNTLKELDVSLSFIPFVEVLDLSHNSIAKTEECLQNLLDLKRINLGYNLLKSVPQFSSVNKLKIKTLVLRNNNLEDLDGVEELIALEELDVSENFLLDHMVLQGLKALKRLQVLCMVGNPLCYKIDHRMLTLQHVYPQAGLGVFLLDGKRLTNHEVMVLQEYQYRYSYDVTMDASTCTLGVRYPDQTTANFQLSPYRYKKKHGHRRKPSKGRLPKIVNIEDCLEENHIIQPLGSPSSTSYTEDSEFDSQKHEDENYYRTIREYYKDDWLYALSAKQSGSAQKNQLGVQVADPQDFDHNDAKERENSKKNDVCFEIQNVKTGTDEKFEDENTFSSKSDGLEQSLTSEIIQTDVYSLVASPSTTDAQLSIQLPASPEVVQIVSSTDSLSRSKLGSRSEGTERKRLLHMYSYDVVDASSSSKEDNSEMYDAEYEEFIMRLADDEMNQLILTVNERFIIERDLSGNITSALDLKSLKKISRTEETCYGKDITGGCLFIILTLDFDYVLKDKRRRRYAVESEDEAQRFESVTSVYIKSVKVEKDNMQCLKCQHEYEAESQDEADLMKCPKCQSKMVIKSEKESFPVRKISSDKVNKENIVKARPPHDSRNKANIWRKSTIRRERKEICSDDANNDDRKEVLLTSDLVERNYINGEFTVSSLNEKVNRNSVTEISSLTNKSSWSDDQKSDVFKSGGRESVSSVESDITVLAGNSSRGSIAIISKSINEQHKSSVTSLPEHEAFSEINSGTGHVTSENDILINDTGIALTKVGEGPFTPVGSPLTNSVCSSMVSSVYEYTISGNVDDISATCNDVPLVDEDQQGHNITEYVSVRRVKRNEKCRQSNNRNLTIFDETRCDISDDNFSSTAERTLNNSSDREISVYDVSDSREKNETKFSDGHESIGSSIYDTSVSDISIETNHDDLLQIASHNAMQLHDGSPTNQVKSEHSSPLRCGRSLLRSRSRSKNRSAVYVDNISYERDVIKNSGAEFPLELSPTRNIILGQESEKNESSASINRTNEILGLHNKSSAHFTTNLNENVPASEDSQESCTNIQLPWEESGNLQLIDKSRQDDSLNHDEFVNIDHKIKLHLELQAFNAEETVQCAIQCDIVQYMKEEVIKSLLVISTHRIIIFRIGVESAASTDWLKSYENQPISELRYIDIGLGYQTLRLEFETECSSYTLLIADEGKCKQFLTLISDIVAHSDHSHLEGIGKSNPTTYTNLENQVLKADDNSSYQKLVSFLMLKYTHANTDEKVRKSLAITQTDLVLIDENHQWPLPRLQASLAGAIKKRQFTIVWREKINNIGTLSFNEFNPKELKLSFLEPTAFGNPSTWIISFETMKGVKSFVDAIRGPWEAEFGISLDISSVAFADSENSSVA